MLIPCDARAASEGTQEIPTHGIPSPRHSPGPALSVDSAVTLTPIINGVEESSEHSVKDVHDVKFGWQWGVEINKYCGLSSETRQGATARQNQMAMQRDGREKSTGQ